MICSKRLYGSEYPIISYFSTTTGNAPTPTNIQLKWKFLYGNHHHLNIPHICNSCIYNSEGRKVNAIGEHFVEYFVHQVLISKYNITSTAEKRRLLDKHGMMTRSLIFPSKNIKTFFLRNVVPRYVLSPYGIQPRKYQLFTVIDQKLIYNRWLTLFEPFNGVVWVTLGIFYWIVAAAILIFLTQFWSEIKDASYDKLCFQMTGLLFRLLGSLLDQNNLRGMHPRFAAVFICWVWLSLNINSGYKGNLFAKLSLAKEPWTPTDLPSLASSSYPIMSTALTIASNYAGTSSSLVYDKRKYKPLFHRYRFLSSRDKLFETNRRAIEFLSYEVLGSLGYS